LAFSSQISGLFWAIITILENAEKNCKLREDLRELRTQHAGNKTSRPRIMLVGCLESSVNVQNSKQMLSVPHQASFSLKYIFSALSVRPRKLCDWLYAI